MRTSRMKIPTVHPKDGRLSDRCLRAHFCFCSPAHHCSGSISSGKCPSSRTSVAGLDASRGSSALSALSPGQARAQPEPSPSPVVRLGLEISDARAHKTRAQTWALSPVRARTTLHGSTMHLRSPSLRLTSSQCCGSFMWYHGRNSVSALLGHSIHTLRPFSPPSSTVWPESRLLTRIALRVGIPECRYVLQ